MSIDWSLISTAINKTTGDSITLKNPQSVSGGCINEAWKVEDQQQRTWFVKLNKPSRTLMFEAELLGLQAIRDSQSILAPKPLCAGKTQQYSFIVMEYLPLKGSPNAADTGTNLAKMHQHIQTTFGWHMDNTIGSTPQINTPKNDWISFWKEQRLLFQLDLALNKGFPHHSYDAGLALAEQLEHFFTTYRPIASLLHGDLWGGNCSANDKGQPVIYDPAVYFGDHETDLAMTELFGGFGSRFMDSYNDTFTIDDGYNTRKTLYSLYHILNHYHLFGGSYGSQAARMIDSLLSELR